MENTSRTLRAVLLLYCNISQSCILSSQDDGLLRCQRNHHSGEIERPRIRNDAGLVRLFLSQNHERSHPKYSQSFSNRLRTHSHVSNGFEEETLLFTHRFEILFRYNHVSSPTTAILSLHQSARTGGALPRRNRVQQSARLCLFDLSRSRAWSKLW